MRCFGVTSLLFLLSGLPSYSQFLSVGIKAGVPFIDAYSTLATSGAPAVSAFQDHFIVGPTAEIHLPLHLSVEVDALYRRNGFSVVGNQSLAGYDIKAAASNWQVPVLLKYEAKLEPIHPFIDTGVVYRRVGGFSESKFITTALCPTTGCPPTLSAPTSKANTAGYAVGGGVAFKLLHLRISPEVRFTRWLTEAYTAPFIKAGSNQADLLVGVTF